MTNGLDLSRALVEAACEREGVREALPEEWFDTDDADYDPGSGRYFNVKERYIGPDLTLPSELYNALRLADAVADKAFPCDLKRVENGDFEAWMWNGINHYGYAPTRSAAVIAALCAALEIPND